MRLPDRYLEAARAAVRLAEAGHEAKAAPSVRRRIRNFLIGPRPALLVFRRTRDEEGRRRLYLVPWPAVLRWYEDPGLHFNKVGVIEVDWLAWTAGLYWKDNN